MSPSQNSDAPDDASIPLLTERLTLPPLELDTTLPLEPQGTSTSAPTVPLALDTSLPLGLPQPPPPLRPAAVPSRSAPAPAAATAPARPAPVPAPTAATARPAPVPAPTAATTRPAPAPAQAAVATPTRPAPVPAPTSATVAGARTTVPDAASNAHWTRIELELRSSILQAIADALPQHVDNIVRTRMNDAIERLYTQLVAETRLAVAASLREIVDQAVRAELMRLRRQKP
jgi:hypothetical protein